MSATRQTITMHREGSPVGPGLLVIEQGSSRVVSLESELVVGRAEECDLVLNHDGVSRRHARFVTRGAGLEVEDLGSHNGTFVNRQRVGGALTLETGDVVEVGEVSLVVHGVGGVRSVSRVVPYPQLLARFEEALAVALRSGAPVSVAAFQLSKAAVSPEVLREVETRLEAGEVVSSYGWDQLLVLLGDQSDAPAIVGRMLEALSKVDDGVRAGLALFPRDGAKAEALLAAARDTAREAKKGELATPADAARTIDIGGQAVYVADPAMRQVYALLGRVATSQVPVLVTGETGAGKENAALAVHHLSKRAAKPFIRVNCAGFQETVVESELFGHEKGAFTGATSARAGLFESADGGTLFLDELGELSAPVQAKLLRVLENRTLTRVGSTKEIPIDVRIVAATNRDLEQEVAAGRFRKDLFFRLCVAVVVLPPLKSRPGEIALLARHFLDAACTRDGRARMEIAASAMDTLCRYDWPGNVRELKNAMDLMSASVPDAVVETWHLPDKVRGGKKAEAKPAVTEQTPLGVRPLAEELAELERRRIVEALEKSRGVQTEAASLLGMPRRTLVFKLRRMRAEGALPAAFRASAD